jgi:subtilisin family serine protease
MRDEVMTIRLRTLVLAVVLAGLSAGQAVAREPEVKPSSAPAEAARQVLVMLRMNPQHFRPDGYGGAYGDGEGRSARWRAAQRLARAQGVSVVDEWPMPVLGVDCFVMSVPDGGTPEELAARLGRDPSVSWSEPLHTYHARGEPKAQAQNDPVPNDPLYRIQPAAREWRLSALHRISTGRDVRVAVIDSGIEAVHPDLAGQVELNRNFVADRPDLAEDHGTGVAGVIAAKANNGVGIVGVAPQARLLGLRACWQEPVGSGEAAGSARTLCDSLSLAKALDFAIARKAQVINMSLSGPPDTLLDRLLDLALADRIVVVAAYDRELPGGGFPASHKGVVAVADEASGPRLPGVFMAPGRDIPTTETGGRWFLVNGSSYAAAHVSGLFALLRQRSPEVHAASALVVTYRSDMIDACATLLQKSTACGCDCVLRHDALSIAGR